MSKITEKFWNNSDFTIKAVITVNMAVFAIAVLLSGKSIYLDMNPFAFMSVSAPVLVRTGATGALVISAGKMWWTLLSAGYNHASLLHIVFNMIAFMSLGRLIASLYGNPVMFSVYTFSTITGFLLSSVAGVPVTVGASAGICGLIGASVIYGMLSKDAFAVIIKQQTSGWILSLVIMGFIIPGINNWGHAGGFAGGAFWGYCTLKTAGIDYIGRIHSAVALFCAIMTILAIGAAFYSGFFNI